MRTEAEVMLAGAFLTDHPGEAAQVLERLTGPAAAIPISRVTPGEAAAVVRGMAPSSGLGCLAHLPAERAREIIAALPHDAALSLLRRADTEQRAAWLAGLVPAKAAMLESRLRHPADAAGALADPDVSAVFEDQTAADAIAQVRRAPGHALPYVYVVDRAQRLVGVVSLRDLMLAPPRTALAALARRDVVRLPASTRGPAILVLASASALRALPVVDEDGALLGAVRHETLRRLEHEHAAGRERGAAVAAVLTFGELCWVGMAGIFGDLAAALAPGRPLATGEDDGRLR